MNRRHFILSLLVVCLISPFSLAELVKKSSSGLCHDTSSPYYERTKNYTTYPSVAACVADGGQARTGTKTLTTPPDIPSYSREAFPHWSDDDGNCVNQRHELLMKQSTSTISTGSNPCTAERGRWFDPYTGKTFYNARDLDIDHVVPLYWAWQHGADQWTKEKRKAFANDEANLLAVQASVNREKGAQGPLEWLPPDSHFQCQYVLRFQQIVLKYQLALSSAESTAMAHLQKRLCQ